MLIGEETIEYQSIISIKVIQKKKKKIQKIRITTIVGVNVPESQIMYISYKWLMIWCTWSRFFANIIAYCRKIDMHGLLYILTDLL